jgi:diphthamide synthase (EF-2-diphthine--ammonia ligase)
LVQEFIDKGFKAVLVCVNEKYLDKSFAGRLIDESFLKDLPPNVDPCGENGEYHSFVFDGPIFKTPVAFEKGEVVYRKYDKGETDNFDTGFFYLDLLPKANTIER